MKSLIGGPGTFSGLVLRVAQVLFASTSIEVMDSALNSHSFITFWLLINLMALQRLWNLVLACLDVFALRMKREFQNPLLVCLLVVGNWGIAILLLATTCSSAAVIVFCTTDSNICSHWPVSSSRFQVSVAFAFITWFLSAISSVVTFWMLASVGN